MSQTITQTNSARSPEVLFETSPEEYFFFAQITCVAGGILNLTNEYFSR